MVMGSSLGELTLNFIFLAFLVLTLIWKGGKETLVVWKIALRNW